MMIDCYVSSSLEQPFTLACFDFNGAMGGIQLSNEVSKVLFWGGVHVYVKMPFHEIKEIIKQCKEDKYGSNGNTHSETTETPLTIIGESQFKLAVFTSKLSDGKELRFLKLISNFPVKDEELKSKIEAIPGIESYNQFGWDRYAANIYKGELFELEPLVTAVEETVKKHLTEKQNQTT